MIETRPERVLMPHTVSPEGDASGWPELLRDDLRLSLGRGQGRWSQAITAIAWIHLLAFVGCQAIYEPERLRDSRMTILWFGEFVAVLVALRAIVGPGWVRSSASIRLISRFWATFLILSFNMVVLNELTGWEVRWYRPAWGTLSTFFLASLAWLFSPRFFIAAVQMYFTALLMYRFKHFDNLIYGVSWWLILLGVGRSIARIERATTPAAAQGPS
jgi:hypothetical protein